MNIDGLIDVFAHTILLRTQLLASAETRLFVSVANCHSGEAEYVRATPENALELMRATMAIPLAYGKVVRVGETPYVDGGVVQPVPIDHTLSLGLPRTIAILTQPPGYRRKRNDLTARLLGLTYAKYPALGRALLARADNANGALERIDRLEREGALSVIRPLRPLPAGRLSRSRADILASVAAGREAGAAWRASHTTP